MKIFIGGVNGVGKTIIANGVAHALGFEYIHATSYLMESLGFRHDYEKLRALTQDARDTQLAQCMQKLLTDKGSYILDSHYLALVRGKVDHVTGPWIKNVDAFVLITAPLEDIWERITADSVKRDRALFPKDKTELEMKRMLDEYQNMTRKEFISLAGKYGKSSTEVSNRKDQQNVAIGEIVRFVQSIK